MLRERNVALVMADDPEMPFQDHGEHTADWVTRSATPRRSGRSSAAEHVGAIAEVRDRP